MEGAWAEGGAALDSGSGRGYLGRNRVMEVASAEAWGRLACLVPEGQNGVSKRWVLREEFRPRCGST